MHLHLSVWNDVLGLDVLNVEPNFNSRTSVPKFNLCSILPETIYYNLHTKSANQKETICLETALGIYNTVSMSHPIKKKLSSYVTLIQNVHMPFGPYANCHIQFSSNNCNCQMNGILLMDSMSNLARHKRKFKWRKRKIKFIELNMHKTIPCVTCLAYLRERIFAVLSSLSHLLCFH